MTTETPTSRFFEAYAALVEKGVARSAFCRAIGCDRRNFDKLLADHSRGIMKADWLGVIVTTYHVSAVWLLTGEGPMFRE